MHKEEEETSSVMELEDIRNQPKDIHIPQQSHSVIAKKFCMTLKPITMKLKTFTINLKTLAINLKTFRR